MAKREKATLFAEVCRAEIRTACGESKLNIKGEQFLSSPLLYTPYITSFIFLITFMQVFLPYFVGSVYLKTDTKTHMPATCKANAKLSRPISMETA